MVLKVEQVIESLFLVNYHSVLQDIKSDAYSEILSR
uniref:Uncharacterized protein n=1 Tax=Anguilla anguilla TaxID=7936 RepID=A0A0E9WU09_ANGAN